MSLTKADQDNIKRTGDLYNGNMHGNMIKFYERLFTDYPEYQKDFPAVANVAIKDLHKNEWLNSFIDRPAIGGAMKKLAALVGDADGTTKYIRQLTAMPQHAGHALTTHDFHNALRLYIVNMRAILGNAFTDEDQYSWLKFTGNLAGLFEAEQFRLDH